MGKEDRHTAGLHQVMTFLSLVTSEVDGTKQKNFCIGAYYPVPTSYFFLLVVVNLEIQRVHVHSCSMKVLNVLNQLYLRNKAYLMFYQNVCAEFILFFTQPSKSSEKRSHSLNNIRADQSSYSGLSFVLSKQKQCTDFAFAFHFFACKLKVPVMRCTYDARSIKGKFIHKKYSN